MITVIDYGMGNLNSVMKALEREGARVCVTASAEEIVMASKIVLPGVGSFGMAMASLKKLRLIPAIKKVINRGTPFLGICLGMQLLLEASEEDRGVAGLGVIRGTVVRFPRSLRLKVPHIGWNRVTYTEKGGTMFSGIKDNSFFYFCHSFYASVKEKQCVSAKTGYGVSFVSALSLNNVWAVQFHPEKSQSAGLRVINNFVRS